MDEITSFLTTEAHELESGRCEDASPDAGSGGGGATEAGLAGVGGASEAGLAEGGVVSELTGGAPLEGGFLRSLL